jgi:hypothetical protein
VQDSTILGRPVFRLAESFDIRQVNRTVRAPLNIVQEERQFRFGPFTFPTYKRLMEFATRHIMAPGCLHPITRFDHSIADFIIIRTHSLLPGILAVIVLPRLIQPRPVSLTVRESHRAGLVDNFGWAGRVIMDAFADDTRNPPGQTAEAIPDGWV